MMLIAGMVAYGYFGIGKKTTTDQSTDQSEEYIVDPNNPKTPDMPQNAWQEYYSGKSDKPPDEGRTGEAYGSASWVSQWTEYPMDIYRAYSGWSNFP